MGFFESFRKKPVPKERIEKVLNGDPEKEALRAQEEAIRAFQNSGAGVKEDEDALERIRRKLKENNG